VGAELEVITSGLIGGMASPLLQAPANALAEVWQETMKARILRTSERIRRKRDGSTESLPITERTAVNALAAAALTDDDVVQEYLAGVVAAATESDDNVQFLALISRLSPLQLRLHHDIYRGTFSCIGRLIPPRISDARWLETSDRNDLNDLFYSGKFVTLLDTEVYGVPLQTHVIKSALEQLHREEVLLLHGIAFVADGRHLSSSTITPTPTEPESMTLAAVISMTDYGIEFMLRALGERFASLRDLRTLDRLVNEKDLDPPLPLNPTLSGVTFDRWYSSAKVEDGWIKGGTPFREATEFDTEHSANGVWGDAVAYARLGENPLDSTFHTPAEPGWDRQRALERAERRKHERKRN
jgi:hypothetical protein